MTIPTNENWLRTFRKVDWSQQGRHWWINNENYPEFHGYLALLSMLSYDSASRKQMAASHISQALTLDRGEERTVLSGVEEDFAQYTFSTRMPESGNVVQVLHLYPDQIRSAHGSPYTVMIYEEEATKRLGMIEITPFTRHHPHFGFRNKPGPGMRQLRYGESIPKGTIFTDSPAVTDDGGYKFSCDLNTAYLALPGTAEDGMIVSQSACKKLRYRRQETRHIRWGSDKIPKPIYPNGKIFPDLGEEVRKDGLLMALLTLLPEDPLVVCDQNNRAMTEVDYNSDELHYVLPGDFIDTDKSLGKGTGCGIVTDIRIWYNGTASNALEENLFELDKQPMKYERHRRQFYRDLLDTYQNIKRLRRAPPETTPDLSLLLEEARSVVGHERKYNPNGNGKDDLRRHRKKEPLDVWEVEITVEYLVEPIEGSKITDFRGGKGVIVGIRRNDEMPRDKLGHYAEVVCDPISRNNRLIPGGPYELYMSAICVHLKETICARTGIMKGDIDAEMKMSMVAQQNPAIFQQCWIDYLKLIELFSPMTYILQENLSLEEQVYILGHGIKNKFQLFVPTHNPINVILAIDEADRYFKPIYDTVTYVADDGVLAETEMPCRIAPVSYMLLEKVADDWSAATSGRTQVFGVLGNVSASDKYSTPVRWNTTRFMGEAENRNFISYAGCKVTVDLHDRSSNPATHRELLKNLLAASNPTDVGLLVDRRFHPLGRSRPLQMVVHTQRVGGFNMKYEPYTDTYLTLNRY